MTPGNHDTPYWNLILRALTPFDRYRRYIGQPDVDAFDAPGLVARSLNSARGAQPRLDWSKGSIAIDRLRGLNWGAPDAPVLKLFACHHPLIDIEGAPVTGGVHRGARAAVVLAEVGVDLILTGHVHNAFVLPIPNAGVSTIVASEDRIEVTALGWSGAGFEPSQTWSLPRQRAPGANLETLAVPAPGQAQDL